MWKTYNWNLFLWSLHRGQSAFYLDNLVGTKLVKRSKTTYIQKRKKIWYGLQLLQEECMSLYLYEKNINDQNYLKVLWEYWSNKKLRDI